MMRRMQRCIGRFLCALVFAIALVLPTNGFAFPDIEVTGASGSNPPFDFGISSTQSGMLLFTDQRMAVSYGETLQLVDMGFYALESEQPPALTSGSSSSDEEDEETASNDDTTGALAAIAYDSGRGQIIASQEDGDILFYDLSNITEQPDTLTLAEDKKLGPLAVDPTGARAFVTNNGDLAVHVVELGGRTLSSTIEVTIPGQESFLFTDAAYVSETGEVYFTTDVGVLLYMASDGTTLTQVTTLTDADDLTAIGVSPDGSFLYITNDTGSTDSVIRFSTATHSEVDTISFVVDETTVNSDPTDVVITQVVDPSATYAYVAGASGMSVINTGTDVLLDLGDDPDQDGEPIPTTAQPIWVVASSSTDGYVYTTFSNADVGVITANPFVTISDLTYSGGDSSLGLGETFTVTFSSDQAGTYEVRAGGSVEADGTLLIDTSGASSGAVEADTDTAVTIGYDDNAAAFAEGDNDLWVFVTAADNRGRRGTTLSVDTPPPAVVISSTGFGDSRIYVTFERLTEEDMASYTVYVDADPDAVLTKEESAASVAQASSGSTQTAEVTGLTNGTTYYVAMEAVDAGGNISATRTSTYADGSRVSETPEQTVGPAQLLGENGCALVADVSGRWWGGALILLALMLLVARRTGAVPWRRLTLLGMFILFLVLPGVAAAAEQPVQEQGVPAIDIGGPSPQWWSFELKTGFWMPQNNVLEQFFGKCCNMWSRAQGGLLVHGRYGAELGVGFLYDSANAVGVTSGRASSDRLSFILVPMELSFAWRADYFSWRYLIPYIKPGFDAVFYRQSLNGATTKGMKYGLHAAGGLMVNVGSLMDVNRDLDADYGINDFFITLEAEYKWIDNFGGKGLDLSGMIYSIGFLFEF